MRVAFFGIFDFLNLTSVYNINGDAARCCHNLILSNKYNTIDEIAII